MLGEGGGNLFGECLKLVAKLGIEEVVHEAGGPLKHFAAVFQSDDGVLKGRRLGVFDNPLHLFLFYAHPFDNCLVDVRHLNIGKGIDVVGCAVCGLE